MRNVTIKDIAIAAKVSINTVSRALNNKGDVNKETKSTILKIAKDLNYFPNLAAKSLHTKKTEVIAVVIANIANPFYANIIKAVESVTRTAGYSIMLCDTSEDLSLERLALEMLMAKRVDGILIVPVKTDENFFRFINGIGIPFVLMNRHPNNPRYDYVINDNYMGASLAITYLVRQRGKTNIVYLTGPRHLNAVKERMEGSRRAIEGFKDGKIKLHIHHIELDMNTCYRETKKILRLYQPPFGLFVYNDLTAIGAMKAVREEGLRIPQDVSIVGYDDIVYGPMLDVPLTTIRQPDFEIGKTAAEVLIQKIQKSPDTEWKSRNIVFRPELVVRES